MNLEHGWEWGPLRNSHYTLKNINLTGGKQMSTVNFETKYKRDLFYKAVEKKN